MKKRILSILLTLCMVLCLVPTSVFAEGEAATESAAIQFGVSGISDPTKITVDGKGNYYTPESYVYFGVNNGDSSTPIKWRVLDADKANDGTTSGMFLLSEYLLASGVKFNSSYDKGNAYQGSDAQTWCSSFATNTSNFSTAEQGVMLGVTKTDSAESDLYSLKWGESSLTANDKQFFLSGRELADYVGNYDGAPGLLATDTAQSAGTWWLRSPYTDYVFYEGTVTIAGSVIHNIGYLRCAARPAFNLNLNSVLFTSAAVGGKADGFNAVPEYTGNEWKMTLLDSNRSNFDVATTVVSASTAGDNVSIEYSGAKTGENEHVSVLLVNSSNEILYYGRIAQNSASGTASVEIPAGLAEGTYTLKVFNEQYNGDCKTDLSSGFKDVTLTVEKRVDEQFILTPGSRYYFDLSAMDIPGTTLETLPDKTMHYVPFTYVGTVDAYSLKNDADTDTTSYEHSLFIADYAMTHTVSWDSLNAQGLIFGKEYTSDGIDYTLRAPSVGSDGAGNGEDERGTPPNNEWDTILDKANQTGGYIKNWMDFMSWGQDSYVRVRTFRISRGLASARFWSSWPCTQPDNYNAFRPVLELPTDLSADSLKIVKLRMREFMPGEDQNWINIIVKNGESFKAPAAEGLPRPDGISADAQLWWVDENFNFYKPGDTVPADVSALAAFWGGFGLLLDRGDGVVEVTPDNYTDIFGDGTASFVFPRGESLENLTEFHNLTYKETLEFYSTGKLEEHGCVFPNFRLNGAKLTEVKFDDTHYSQYTSEDCFFITLTGENSIESLKTGYAVDNIGIIDGGSLTLNSALKLNQYTQFGGSSVAMTDGLKAYNLIVDSGSLTVTGDTQAITLRDQNISNLNMGDGVRLFKGSSAQDAAEAVIPQLSAEIQELYKRYQADDNTLTSADYIALFNALREQFDAIFPQLSGKTYVRIANAWDVTYQPGTNGTGNIATDVKFYGDALTLRGKLFTRTGYTQTGWTTTDGGEKIYGLDAVYTQNEALTLYPVWNTNKYTITFDTAGGSKIDSITQDYGTTITAPANPTREGYTFIGWNKEIPATMPAENITITAQWKDTEKPTGEISVGTSKWKTFLNNITFGLFFNETQTVTITAADNSGEAVTVEYLLSSKELTKAELDGMTFTAYTAPLGIDPDNEYIIYVRLTDKTGNTDYICSDGIVLDGTAPMISGVENGKTYCEAQTVTITEKYMDTVTVNGTAVTLDENNSFVLSPADGEQKIVATDKAGNIAEMTVTVNDGHTFGEWASNGDGTHTHKCTIDGCNGTETENCSGGKATCTEKAVCEVCRKAYGELDANNHADLKHIDAKAATKDSEGNIEYWYCEGCGKYYSDASAAKEIAKAETVTAKLPGEPKSPQTGDNSSLMLWIALLFISGGVCTALTVKRKKSH